MENQSTINPTRTTSEEQSQNQQQRTVKKKTNKDRGIGVADYYYQFMGFQFESADTKDYQKSKPKKYSQTYFSHSKSSRLIHLSALKNFKKSYMQGNFRFLMNPSFEGEPRCIISSVWSQFKKFSIIVYPPDQNIPWDFVEQVIWFFVCSYEGFSLQK